MYDFHQALGIICDLLLIASFFGCLYLLASAILVWTFRLDVPQAVHDPLPVTVLVPLCGREPHLERRLRLVYQQDYPAPVQVICGVRTRSDPAAVLARQLACESNRSDVALIVDGRTYGRNLKISNLVNMMRSARYETLVLIDSDVEVGPHFLVDMISRLQRPGVGLVTCLYWGSSTKNFWSRIAALSTNAFFLSDAIFALRLRLAEPCFGASIALSRSTLQRIGGFGAFVDQICDDYAMGEAVRAQGLHVELGPMVAHLCCAETANELFSNEIRAARSARMVSLFGQAGRVVAYPAPLALVAVILGAGVSGLVLAAAGFAGRFLVNWSFSSRFDVPVRSSELLPVTEFFVFSAFAVSWFRKSVRWRRQHCEFSETKADGRRTCNYG